MFRRRPRSAEDAARRWLTPQVRRVAVLAGRPVDTALLRQHAPQAEVVIHDVPRDSEGARLSVRDAFRRDGPYDVIFDALNLTPGRRKRWFVTLFLHTRDRGVYLVVDPPPGGPIDYVTGVRTHAASGQASDTEPKWARDAAVVRAIADVKAGTHLTAVIRRGTDFAVDVARVGRTVADSGPNAITLDLGRTHRVTSVTVTAPMIGANIVVSASNTGQVWHEVGRASADAQRDAPLVVPLEASIWTRHLQIVGVTPKSGRPEVLVAPHVADLARPNKVITTRRTDGLGERLNSMLAGIRLASLLGLEYRLTWPDDLADDPHHAIRRSAEMFTPEYLAAHQEAPDSNLGVPVLRGEDLGPDQLDHVLLHTRALRCPSEGLLPVLDASKISGLHEPYLPEFESIGFAPDLLEAVRLARQVRLPSSPAALHLRGGDVVMGHARLWGWWSDKAMPIPVAREVVRRLQSAGHTVVLFGQDHDAMDELHRSAGAVPVDQLDLPAIEDRTARALFEIVLLGRCESVVSGTSGFARQGAALSGVRPLTPGDLMTPAEQIAACRSDARLVAGEYSALQTAFAWWSTFRTARDAGLEDEHSIADVKRAAEYDPANSLYPLAEAAAHYRADRWSEGDQIMARRLVDESKRDRRLTVLSTFATRREDTLLLTPEVAAFTRAAEHSAIAQYVTASLLFVERDIAAMVDQIRSVHDELTQGLLSEMTIGLVDGALQAVPDQTLPSRQDGDACDFTAAVQHWRADHERTDART